MSWMLASAATPSSFAASAGDMVSAHPLGTDLGGVDALRDGELVGGERAQSVADRDHLALAQSVLELAEPAVDLVQLDRVLVGTDLQRGDRNVRQDAVDLAPLVLEHAAGAALRPLGDQHDARATDRAIHRVLGARVHGDRHLAAAPAPLERAAQDRADRSGLTLDL